MAIKILKKLQDTATTHTAINKLKYIHITRDFFKVVV